ncbi:MAG: amidohydrolase family protein [Lachnospiraceae bacterium]|nr:amidohydrolase family protein [Lachnospiraceae bacterium]
MLLLKNCKLVGELTEGTELTMADIVMNDKTITDIVPCGSVAEEGYEVLDVKGATVLPGLINAHVHLFGADYPKAWWAYESAADRTLDSLRFAQYLMENGYTTVRDCGDDLRYLTIAVRNQIREGYFKGPNILCSGPTLLPSEIGCEGLEWMCKFCDTPMDYRVAVREVLKNGADFAKIYGTGSMIAPGSVPGLRIMMEDEIIEAVQTAKLKNTYCAIHCHGAECIDMAVTNGVRTIEHATFISDDTCKKMDGRTDVGLVLTLSLVYEWLQAETIPAEKQETLDNMIAALKNAYAHDILIGWGTDVGMDVQKKEVGMEFRLRKELLGFSNIDMLKQATINSAKLIMMEDKVGSIKVGKMADLVVIDGDPVEDISLMYGAPAHVIKSGEVVK